MSRFNFVRIHRVTADILNCSVCGAVPAGRIIYACANKSRKCTISFVKNNYGTYHGIPQKNSAFQADANYRVKATKDKNKPVFRIEKSKGSIPENLVNSDNYFDNKTGAIPRNIEIIGNHFIDGWHAENTQPFEVVAARMNGRIGITRDEPVSAGYGIDWNGITNIRIEDNHFLNWNPLAHFPTQTSILHQTNSEVSRYSINFCHKKQENERPVYISC